MTEARDSSLQTVIRGATLVFIGMVINLPLWFATRVLITRNVTKEELGFYSIIAAVAGIVSIISCLGIPDGIVRFVSLYIGQSQKENALSISKSAMLIGFFSGAISSISLFLFSDIIARDVFYKPDISTYLRIIAPFIFFSVLISIRFGILRGYNIMAPKVYFQDIGQPFSFLIFLIIIFSLGMPFDGVIYAYLFALIIVFLSTEIFSHVKTGMNIFKLGGWTQGSDLIRFSTPLLIASVLGVALTWCDTLILGRYTEAADVGVYNVSISLARLLIVPLAAIEFAYMPIAGDLYGKRQYDNLNMTYQTLTKWNFAATLPIFIILFFFPEMTITFFFGDQFIDASNALRILSVGFLIHSFLGANSVLMIIIGMQKAFMNVSIGCALLNIFLNYIFVKHMGYGIEGSALATAISYTVINIIISTIIYRTNGLHPITSQYLKPIAGSIIIGAVIYIIAKLLPLKLWILPLYLVSFISGYFALLILTRSLNADDIFILKMALEKLRIRTAIVNHIVDRLEKLVQGSSKKHDGCP